MAACKMLGSKELWCLVICSHFLVTLSCRDTLTKTKMFRYSGFRGLPKIPPVFSTTTATKEVCSIACVRHTACKSFSFRNGTEGCSLFPMKIMALDVDPSFSSEEVHFFRVLASCPEWKGYVTVPGTTKCIRVENVTKPWTQAAEVCAEDGGHLLIIENVDAMQKLQDFLPPGKHYVGFNDMDTEDQHLWLDRTPVNRTLFHATEPNDATSSSQQDCGLLQIGRRNAGLHDVSCSKSRTFLCALPVE